MGMSSNNNYYTTTQQSHNKTHRAFLFCNYTLLGAASSCLFLTLSLRLIPSLCGLFFILLHILTILGAVAGCAIASGGSHGWYIGHMVATVLAAIFQGSISVLVFVKPDDFLDKLDSYVLRADGEKIVKLVGGLCAAVFFLEWVVLILAFFLKYYGGYVDEGGDWRKSSNAQGKESSLENWPWPFQV